VELPAHGNLLRTPRNTVVTDDQLSTERGRIAKYDRSGECIVNQRPAVGQLCALNYHSPGGDDIVIQTSADGGVLRGH